jgi:PAS domain S-box-containing protein
MIKSTCLNNKNPLFYIAQALLLAIIYFVAGELSFSLKVSHHVITLIVFTAEGFALAAVILLGIRIVPGIFIGQLLLGLNNNLSLEIAVAIAIINSLEAIMASVLFHTLHLRQQLTRVRDIRNLLLLIFLVLQPFSASFGVLLLWNAEIIQTSELKLSWISWWFGNAMGQTLITPLLLSFSTARESLRQQLYKLSLTVILITPISLFIFSQIEFSSIAFSVTTILLILLALNLGMSSATLAAVIFAIMALFYSYHGQGAFVENEEIRILDLNIFLLGMALCSQFIAAFFTERKKMETDFKASEQRFIDIVNSSESIVWEADAQTFNITFVSSKAERLLGYSISDWYQSGFWLQHLHPDDKAWVSEYCTNCTKKMQPYELEYRFIAKNSDIVWLRDIVSVSSENNHPRWLRGVMIDISDHKQAENALKRSEQQFRTTFEHAPIGVINLSLKGDFLAVNQYFCTMMNYTHDELLSMNIKQIIYSNSNTPPQNSVDEIANNVPVETQYVRKDGKIIWGNDSVHLFHHSNGLPHYFIRTVEDITERKYNEERVKLSQTYGGIVTWEANLCTNQQTWSKEATNLFKLPLLNDASWEYFLAIIHPEDRKKVMNKIRAHLLRNAPYDVEYRIIDCEQQTRWIRSAGRAERDAVGKAICLRGIGQDITQRKLMEQSLHDSKQLLQSVMNILPIGLWILDGKGNILQGNPAAKKIWVGVRYVGIEKYGEYKAWSMDTKKRVQAHEWAAVRAINQGESTLDEELEIECFDKSHKIINHSVVPLFDDYNKVKGAIVVNRDITAKKQAEQELQRSNADLEQFAYAVSHDMRQPLRMVSSYLTLLESSLDKQLDTETQQFLKFALDGAKRMDEMILALLEFSRVGHKTEGMALIDSHAALDEALLFLAPEIKINRAIINTSGKWLKLFANQDEITRLLQNLIGNALKYHQQDKVPQIEIGAKVVENNFQVAVSDNGIGIDPSQIERLFKVFSRLQPRSHFEGTGVGLALCRKIVEHHMGKIWVESEGEGEGSVFKFSLPIKTNTTE